MASILILGGTAWLGAEIARAGIAREHQVTCLARGESGTVPAGATFVQADRNDRDAYKVVQDTRWDHVFDVSWQPRFVREAVATLGPVSSHWTYVSSVSVYAEPGGDENAPTVPPLEAELAGDDTDGAAKMACEQIVAELSHTSIVRAGLLAGPGDRSDRFGYWVSRFALAADGPVLVPDEMKVPVQVLDVRDLAMWLMESSLAGLTGTFNAVGEPTTFGDLVASSAIAGGFRGDQVVAPSSWLIDNDVQPWMGPRSLPLWLPEGSSARSGNRAIAEGLTRRPVATVLNDTLADERSRGLDRDRMAGLTRADELDLIDRLIAQTRT